MNGIDISSWQRGINLAVVPCDFVIIKATGGVGYVNDDCDRAYQQAKSLGKCIGFYHYAREAGCPGSAEDEAQFFVNSCANYFGEALPILDWEQELGLGPGWAKAWLDRVYRLTGVRPMIYMSKSVCNAYDWSAVSTANYGLWYAQYADMAVHNGYQDDPWTDSSGVGSWPFAAMFQYSSTTRLPGYDGNLDVNVFYGDASTWAAYAGGKTVVSPPQPDAQAPTPSATCDPIDILADQVIAGQWGNGEDRKNRIYNAVQTRVNEKLA